MPRLRVRTLLASDRDAIIDYARASASLHRGLVKPPNTPAKFATYLRSSRKKSNSFLVVEHIEEKQLIGVINFSQIFYGQLKSAYMGYHVHAKYANQGFMTEALPLALRHAFRTLKLHRVEANIQPGNRASIKLVQRAGFRKEGYSIKYVKVGGKWRDHLRFALLADEWNRRS